MISVGTRRLLENDHPCKSSLICPSNRPLRPFRLSSQGSPLRLPLVARLQRRAPSGLLTVPGSWQEIFWAPLGLNGILCQHEILQRLPSSSAFHPPAPTFLHRLDFSSACHSPAPSHFSNAYHFPSAYHSSNAYLSPAPAIL